MGAAAPDRGILSPRSGAAQEAHKLLERKIIDECAKSKKLWEDPDFPAAPPSLYRKLAASTYKFLSILFLSNKNNNGGQCT